MFGCIGRLGCGLVLIVLGAAGWHYRDVWMPKAKELITAEMPWDHDEWSRVTITGGERAEARMRQLQEPTGPTFVNVSGADFTGFALRAALPAILAIDTMPEALVDDGILYLRMRVRLADFGGADLGQLPAVFGESERLTIAGRVESLRPGLARYRPTEVALKDLRIPPASLARLFGKWNAAVPADSVGGGALPIVLPRYVADLRVTDTRITLYKDAR